MMRRFTLAFLALACCASAADAMVLSCLPERAGGPVKIDAYVDGFAKGEYPPQAIESVRVLVRFGEDPYEYFPEQTRRAEVKDGTLQLHLAQALSAGESAEIRFQGRLAAKRGEPFLMDMQIRAGRRAASGQVRCTIE